jgi:hypothetical protein
MKRTLVLLGLISWGCGGGAFENTDSSGGSAGEGGASGGKAPSEGGRASGGAAATGGTPHGGGVTSVGGTLASGGTVGEGGTESSGGNARGGKGGGSSTGGAVAKGGSTSTGGAGGSTSTGGKGGKGGSTSTGGSSMGSGGASSGGATNTGGASAGTGGSLGELSCEQLRERYDVVLAQAKVCSPAHTDPCTVSVTSDLFCGCQTFVSTQNQQALDELTALVKAASKRTCQVLCPLIACIEPVGATCQATATTGSSIAYACKATSDAAL